MIAAILLPIVSLTLYITTNNSLFIYLYFISLCLAMYYIRSFPIYISLGSAALSLISLYLGYNDLALGFLFIASGSLSMAAMMYGLITESVLSLLVLSSLVLMALASTPIQTPQTIYHFSTPTIFTWY